MLQTVIRPSIDERADRRAGELDRVAGAAGGADRADDRQHDVLGRAAARQACPSTLTSMFFALRASSVCVASTCSTSLVPMPCASAPNAPWVEVCESPQTTVMPGSVAPCSGPITWTMPWRRSFILNWVMPHLSQLASSVSTCSLRDRVGDAVRAVGGRHVVVADREVGGDAPDLAPGLLEAVEGLRAGHLVDEVAVDVEQRGAVVLGADDVLVPELVVEGSAIRHPRSILGARAQKTRGTSPCPRLRDARNCRPPVSARCGDRLDACAARRRCRAGAAGRSCTPGRRSSRSAGRSSRPCAPARRSR